MLAGLIIASAEVEGETLLAAELPVAGQTLLEQQVRLIAQGGAQHIVVLVERLPPPLLAAIDRLRRGGIAIDVARNVADAADRIHPDERLLLVADGLITDQALVALMTAQEGLAVLALPDTPENREWERIDANSRWGGLALLDGALLRNTAAMLGDWDLQSTLLRRALQSGALSIDVPAGDGAPLLSVVDDREGAAAIGDKLARRVTHEAVGLPDKLLFAPLARLVAPQAMRAMILPSWFRLGAVLSSAAAAIGFGFGFLWTGIVLLLLPGPLDAIGRYIAALGLRPEREEKRWRLARLGVSAAALLALGWRLAENGGGWGCWVLAIVAIGLMAAAADHRRLFGEGRKRPVWLAEIDSLIWLFLPFAIGDAWRLGLGALAAYAFVTLLMTQRLSATQPRFRTS